MVAMLLFLMLFTFAKAVSGQIFTVVSGACAVVEGGRCITSPNYPAYYGNNQDCRATVNFEAAIFAVAFETESNYDNVTIDGGQEYSGSNFPEVVASSQFTFSSDGRISAVFLSLGISVTTDSKSSKQSL